MKIYIAGPDVFEKNAVEIGRKYKALCEKYGHTGLFPLDNECSSSKEICGANIGLINESDAVIANGNEFRGEMDVGTAFEIGYAAAKNKIIIVYMEDTSSLVEKYGREDEKGRNVEDFFKFFCAFTLLPQLLPYRKRSSQRQQASRSSKCRPHQP